MSPTIITKDGKPWLITGSPGGRTIISTVLLTILAAVDFGKNAQECVDAGRFHHQWLPDRIVIEKGMFSKTTLDALWAMGHVLYEVANQGRAQLILMEDGKWGAGADVIRWADSAAAWE